MASSDLSSKFPQINLNMREMSKRRVYEFENFRLDADNLLLFCGGEQLALTPKVVATLLALVERPGEIINKDDLMEIVWPDAAVEEGNLTQNIYLLRRTLGDSSGGKPFIETLRRRGYRFSADILLVHDKFKKPEIFAPAVLVKRKKNLYSVVNWQGKNRDDIADEADNQEVAIQPLEIIQAPRRRWIFPVVALVSMLVIALAIFDPFKISADRSSLDLRNELTFNQLTDGRDVNDATISPNGEYFTYHEIDSGVSSIWVQQVGHSTRVEVVPATAKTFQSKTFSPDGQFIYFVAVEKDATVASLYRVPTLGGVQTKLLDDLGSTVAVSPDGRHLAFARSYKDATRTEIIVADEDGGNPQTILTGRERSIIWGGLAWSPNGSSIAFGEVDMKRPTSKGKCTISAVDTKTKTVRDLSPDKWDTCGRMEWTHDSEGLLFIGTRSGEAVTTRRDQLFYLSLDTGKAKRLTSDGNRHQVSSLGVTRAGAVLVVPFNRSSQLWILDANGNSESARQITNGQADGRAGIAPLPDGRIGYTARAGDSLGILTVNSDGTDSRQITAEPNQIEEIKANGDGSYFYFTLHAEGKPQLKRINVDGSDPRVVIDDDSFDVDSSVSPDGNWIVYNSAISEAESLKNTLRLAPTGGGSFIQLTNQFSVAPHFSPDGRYVSFIGSNDTINVVTVPEGNVIATFRPKLMPILNTGARWMPDGKALAYIARKKSVGNIWTQPLDGSDPKPLTDFSSGEIYNFAFTADGQKLILARGYPIQNALLVKIEP